MKLTEDVCKIDNTATGVNFEMKGWCEIYLGVDFTKLMLFLINLKRIKTLFSGIPVLFRCVITVDASAMKICAIHLSVPKIQTMSKHRLEKNIVLEEELIQKAGTAFFVICLAP